MRFIKSNPAKTWKLKPHTNKDGVVSYNYYSWDWAKTPSEQVDNFIFYAKIKYVGYGKGRSSATYYFVDSDNKNEYQFGSVGFDLLFQDLQCGEKTFDKDGFISGTWTFKKQGSEILLFPIDV